MAQCPSCKQKLRLTDVSQNCPHCGVNMRFYGFEDRFHSDAKRAELSLARSQLFIRTLKAALIGGRLPIARLVLLLPLILTLLAPGASAVIPLPFGQETLNLHLVGVIMTVLGGGLDGNTGILALLPAMTGSAVNGKATLWLLSAFGAYVLTVLSAILCILFTILSFLNIRRTAKLNCAVCCIGAAAQVVEAFFALCCRGAHAPVSMTLSFGPAAVILAFGVFFAANLMILKKGIPVELDEGVEERVRIAKAIRKKEMRLEDLPQPIVETPETQALRKKILAEKRDAETDDGSDGGEEK